MKKEIRRAIKTWKALHQLTFLNSKSTCEIDAFLAHENALLDLEGVLQRAVEADESKTTPVITVD